MVESAAPRSLAIGVGAGSRELAGQANVLRLTIGEAEGVSPTRRTVAVLETAIDDENPATVAALIPGLLAAGALDAMLVPSVMKGPHRTLAGRGVRSRLGSRAAERILLETTSLGVRVRMDERWELPGGSPRGDTAYGAIALKVATLPDGGERAVPEFESVRAAAERSGRTLREVSEAALAAWRERGGAKR
jgi:uncharacterized protein (DUF111 family)